MSTFDKVNNQEIKNLKTISFSIHIDSDRERIWRVLWNPATYEQWAGVFSEGSHCVGEIKQGNTVQFLGKDGGGMCSYIEKMVENEQMVFVHQKEIINGFETHSNWQDAKEIYYLKKGTQTGTELQIVMDIIPDMEEYFNEAFPKALFRIRQLSEQAF